MVCKHLFRVLICSIVGIFTLTTILYSQVVPYYLPTDHETVYCHDIDLSWPLSHQKTRIQIATDRNFYNVIIDTSVVSHRLTIHSLPKNESYYWRKKDIQSLRWENYWVFHTSSIRIDQENIQSNIRLLPLMVMDQHMIVIDNPDKNMMDICVYDHDCNLLIHQKSDASRKHIDIDHWTQSVDYQVKISANDDILESNVFIHEF